MTEDAAEEVQRIELESSSVMVGWGLFAEGKDSRSLVAWFRYRVDARTFRQQVGTVAFRSGRIRILPVVIVNDEVLYDPEGDDDTMIPKLRKVAGVPPWLKWHYGPDLVNEL